MTDSSAVKYRINRLKYWISERQNIFLLKEADAPVPWSHDDILNKYRFCNVYREQDKVTRWIAENLRNDGDKYPWFTMTLARLLNLPESLAVVKKFLYHMGVLEWNAETFIEIMQYRQNHERKVFNGAYIVSTNGHAMNKIEYITCFILQPMWESRTVLNYALNKAKSLNEIHKLLMGQNGLASFMAAQVVADLKHYSRFSNMPDHKTFSAPGPGSKRGMNRVIGRDPKQSMSDTEWHEHMDILHPVICSDFRDAIHLPFIDAQDLQNCLCEFDKYMRAYNDEGTPKQIYRRD